MLPALGALVLLVAGRRRGPLGPLARLLTVVAAFVVGLLIFLETTGLPEAQRSRELSLFQWIARRRAATSTSGCGSTRCR